MVRWMTCSSAMGTHQSNQLEGSISREPGTSVDRNSTKWCRSELHEATISFERDCVRVAASQPVDMSFEEKQANSSAFSLCWKHLSLNPSKHFEFVVHGSPKSPKYEVRMDHSLVEKLRLLHDVATNADDSGCAAPMKLTLSTWGLVSLLVLLEGGVTPQQWFEGAEGCEPVASLPGQTLEVACYLDCVTVKRDVVAWLQQCLTQVVDAYAYCASDNRKRTAAFLDYSTTWDLTEVLRLAIMMAPEPIKQDIMAKLTEVQGTAVAIEKVAHLPQDLLCQWLECLAPIVDLRDANLQSEMVAKVLACLPVVRGERVQELHVPLSPSIPDVLSHSEPLKSAIASLDLTNVGIVNFGRCSSDITPHPLPGRRCPSHLSLGGVCPRCKRISATFCGVPDVPIAQACSGSNALLELFKYAAEHIPSHSNLLRCGNCSHTSVATGATHLIYGCICTCRDCDCFVPSYDAQHPVLPDLTGHLHSTQGSAPDALMLGGFASNMTSLHHLGLHNIRLSQATIQSLGQLLASLPYNVMTLTLGTLGGDLNRSEKKYLFKAIARMRSLRQLCMPQWEMVVGGDAAACVVPLKGLRNFQAVFVAEVKMSDAFPAGIKFKPLDAKE